MFVSIIDLQIGQGDADTLLSRIENDLIPIYEDAEGFIGNRIHALFYLTG